MAACKRLRSTLKIYCICLVLSELHLSVISNFTKRHCSCDFKKISTRLDLFIYVGLQFLGEWHGLYQEATNTSCERSSWHHVARTLFLVVVWSWPMVGRHPWACVPLFFFRRLDVRVHRTSIHGQTTGLMGWMLMSIELATSIDVASFRYPLTVAMQLQYLHTSTYWFVHLFVPLVYIRVRDYIFSKKRLRRVLKKQTDNHQTMPACE